LKNWWRAATVGSYKEKYSDDRALNSVQDYSN